MSDFVAGGARFDDGGEPEQELKIAKYLEPGEGIDADICLSQNIRSLMGNFPKLEQFVFRHPNIKAIALQEVWAPDFPPKLQGFQKFISRTRSKRKGGGIGFYLAEDLQYDIIDSPFTEGVLETLCIELKLGKNKKTRIFNVYRPPDSNPAELLQWITEIPISNSYHTIVLGDFNIDITDVRKHALIETFADKGLGSLIDIATRQTSTTATIIDHVYSNVRKSRSFVYTTSMSDHYSVAITLNDKRSKASKGSKRISRPLHDERSLNYLLDYLKAQRVSGGWESLYNCRTPKAFDIFEEFMKDAQEICCPVVPKNQRKIPKHPWMTKELLKVRAKKEKLHRKARQKNDQESWEAFKSFSKAFYKQCNDAKDSYYGREFAEAGNDGRKLWQIANEVTGRPTKKSNNNKIGPIENCSTNKESAAKINHFFANVANDLKNKIKKSKKSFSDYLSMNDSVPQEELRLRTVSIEKVEQLIDNMKAKTSYSHDTMSNKVLKHLKTEISKPLTHLINISIIHNHVPNSWKTAKMCPIFKSGDPSQPTNYRPISLLPTMSKILERAVSNQVYGFLERNKLFYPLQFGYRHRHSCEGLLLNLMDYISKARDKNKHVLNIYIDLRKAFDTVPWDIMFKKLKHYGLPVKWFQSYLSNRKMYTRVEDTDSEMEDILCGVPQGSILGPLLFILFIGDLPSVTKFYTLLYCDDTTFAHAHSDLSTLFKETNEMLHEVEDWFDANFLSLHPGKTRFILFSSENTSLSLTLQGKEIERVHENGTEKSFKLVGVHLDENLTFKYHIKHVHKKLIAMTSLIRRSKKSIPPRIKKMLFHSLVQSHISYCLPVWGGAQNKLLEPLKISQKKAARAACNVKGNAHSASCFQNLEALQFNDMYKLACAKVAVSSVNNVQIPGLQDCYIPTRKTKQNYSKNCFEANYGPRTRLQDSDDLKVPDYYSNKLRMLPPYKIPKIWNEIDENIKNLGIISFASAFKMQALNDYENFTCNKKNCYACKWTRALQRPAGTEHCQDLAKYITGFKFS